MGVWGTGLYSGDFAKDLSSAVRAVSQLPFDGERLAELLCSVEPAAAINSSDEDHTTFWLVVADQFAKRGIACERVRKRALEIIDSGEDLAMLTRRGMDPAGVRKRGKMLAELREKIEKPVAAVSPRRVLKKPQTLVMNEGDVVVYPTGRGRPINPYFASVEKMRPEWVQDGWGAAVIAEVGREFGFLAWYRPLTISNAIGEKPGLQQLLDSAVWVMRLPATCPASHLKKMRLETIGRLQVAPAKVKELFPNEPTGRSAAVNDVSIANRLSVGPAFSAERIYFTREASIDKPRWQYAGIRRIEEIFV